MVRTLPDFWKAKMLPEPARVPGELKLCCVAKGNIPATSETSISLGAPDEGYMWYLYHVWGSINRNSLIQIWVDWYGDAVQRDYGYGKGKILIIKGLDYAPDNELVVNLRNYADVIVNAVLCINGVELKVG